MNIKRSVISLCLSCCLGASAYAQTIEIQCSFPEMERNEFRWFIQPMENDSTSARVELENDGKGLFNATLKATSDGFYKLYGTDQKSQLILPFYLPGEGKQKVLNIHKEKNVLVLNLNPENRALSEYNAFIVDASRKLWEEGKKMNSEQLMDLLKGYDQEVSRLIEKYGCAEPVCKYLRLYAYTSAYSDCLKLDFITNKSREEIGFTANDFLERPEKVLDQPMARYFYTTNQIILSTIPRGTIESKLDYLGKSYHCNVVRKDLEDSILLLYLSNFNYDRNYEAGLEEMERLTSKFNLKDTYLNMFKQRRFAREGAPFPTEISLLDANGNKVSFDQFKGFYVYIDMWASWCAPCCREVPHLQALEKAVQNPKVKFVSISTDTRIPAWKNKMKALNMKGNQFIEPEGKLGEALNITGIPHFLIYDKEGKLLHYNAPRPSQGEGLKILLENLK